MNSQQLFAARFNMLLKSIIRQRNRLIKNHISGLPIELVQPKLDYLSRYINYGFTDKGAAQFLIDHRSEIEFLIPDNISGRSTMLHVETLIEAAKILTTKLPSHAH